MSIARVLLAAPLGVALLVLGLAGVSLWRTTPPPAGGLEGEPLPVFIAEALAGRSGAGQDAVLEGALDAQGLMGGPYMLNVWASWCVPCRVEHPQLMQLSAAGVTVHGLVWRDAEVDARAFLQELGDPFSHVGVDPDGRIGERLGVSGAPETYIIDADGVVAAHIKGPLTPDVMARVVGPRLRALKVL